MSRRSHPAEPRVAAPDRGAARRARVPPRPSGRRRRRAPPPRPARSRRPDQHGAAEAARIAAYWTPARMRSAPPLLASGRSRPAGAAPASPPVDRRDRPPLRRQRPHLHPPGPRAGLLLGDGDRQPQPAAGPDRRPLRQHRPARAPGGSSAWSRFLEFVPAYTDGTAPFGAFVARRNAVYAPKPWVKQGNPNFDIGAVLTEPNESGVNVADAVGGGATIALDLARKQHFQTFGYPGKVAPAAGAADSPAIGEDTLTRRIPGPPTVSDPLPLAARRQRRRLADRRRHRDRRPDQLRPRPRRRPHLRPLLQRRKRRRPRRRPLDRLRR